MSYSSENKNEADEICDYLESNGKSCWIAPRDIPVGAEYGEEIIKGLESSSALVLVFSRASNKSQHVLREVERAVSKNVPIIAFRIEECDVSKSLEYFISSCQWLDASGDMCGTLAELNIGIDGLLNADKDLFTPDEATKSAVHPTKSALPILAGVIAVALVAATAGIFFAQNGKSDPIEMPVSSSEAAVTTSSSAVSVETTLTEVTSETAPTDAPVSESEAELETEAVQAAAVNPLPTFCAGDFVMFGRYYPTGYSDENNDGEIKWQVLEADEHSVKLISAEIIDIKPYDCAESGKYERDSSGNYYDRDKPDSYSDEQLKEFFGSGDWLTSDLRAWLISDANPNYYGKLPSDAATDDYGNAFGTQLGFLSSFSKAERGMLLGTGVQDCENDTVTLLSYDEVFAYAESDSFILHPTVTKSAAASDTTSWYVTYSSNGAPDYLWVTRTPYEYMSYQVYVVDTSLAHEMITPYTAACSGFGIRPVIRIDTQSLDPLLIDGDGTNAFPYTLSAVK